VLFILEVNTHLHTWHFCCLWWKSYPVWCWPPQYIPNTSLNASTSFKLVRRSEGTLAKWLDCCR
jgi:hypothetical protein